MEKKIEIFNLIIAIISKNEDLLPRIPIAEVALSTSLSADCGFDSLALMSILYELQETYPALNENIILEVKTFNDLIDNIIDKA